MFWKMLWVAVPSMLVAATALSDFGKVSAISLITLFVSSLAQKLTLY